jgi:hypothetical protein
MLQGGMGLQISMKMQACAFLGRELRGYKALK